MCGVASIGLCAAGIPFGLAGLLLGLLALGRARERPGNPGRGVAISGIVTSVLGGALGALVLTLVLTGVVLAAREEQRSSGIADPDAYELSVAAPVVDEFGATCGGEIRNRSGTDRGFRLEVEFRDGAGVRLDRVGVVERDVEAGGSAVWRAYAPGAGGTADCAVVEVRNAR